MLWAARLPELPSPDPSRRTEALGSLSVWCLQFTPARRRHPAPRRGAGRDDGGRGQRQAVRRQAKARRTRQAGGDRPRRPAAELGAPHRVGVIVPAPAAQTSMFALVSSNWRGLLNAAVMDTAEAAELVSGPKITSPTTGSRLRPGTRERSSSGKKFGRLNAIRSKVCCSRIGECRSQKKSRPWRVAGLTATLGSESIYLRA